MPTGFVSDEKESKETAQVEETVTSEDQKQEETSSVEQEDANNSEDFSQMLEDTLTDVSKIVEGDVVKGKVIAINDKYIFVTLGGNNEAYAEREDYQTKAGKLKISIGDDLTGFVVKKTETEIVISKSLNRKHVDKGFLREAYEKRVPVNGKMISTIKGGFSVEVLGTRAFCPFSQADIRYIADPQKMIGHYYDFEITEISSDMRNIVLSRKALLEKEVNVIKEETLKNIEVGAILKGTVSRIADFGVFVDLGGIDGLLHISQLSWVKVDTPRDVVKPGDEITVKVIGLDGEKISLSMKELYPNPMEKALEEIKEGDVVKCRILRNESFGSFCEIQAGVEGLIPISEMLRGSRVNDPSEVVSIGDLVEAQIIRINRSEKKISLSLKALQDDPWEHIEEHLSEGDTIEGIIESYTNFGLFVRIRDGLTGLLPKSKMMKLKIKYSEADVGTKITLRVVQIDREKRRISLEPLENQINPDAPVTSRPRNEDRKPQGEKPDWRKYVIANQEVPEDNPFSVL